MTKKELQVVITAKNEATKEFRKLGSQLREINSRFSTERKVLIGVGAGMAAVATGAGYLTYQIAETGMTFSRLGKNVEVVAKNMGIGKDQIDEWTNSLRDANLYGVEARETLLTFIQGGISSMTDMKKFTLVAKDYAASIGVSSKKGVKDFTKAIGTLRPELLDQYRITLNLTEVYKKHASSIGKKVSEMTGEEKRLALLNEIYKQHDKTVKGIYGETYDEASKAISSIMDAWSGVKAYLGLVLAPGIQAVAVPMRDFLKSSVVWLGENEAMLKQWGEVLRTEVGAKIDEVKQKVIEWYEEIGGAEGLKAKLLSVWDVLSNQVIPALVTFGKIVFVATLFVMKHWKAMLLIIGAYEAFKIALAIIATVKAVSGAITALTTIIGANTVATTALTTAMSVLSTVALPALVLALGALVVYGVAKAMQSFQDLQEELKVLNKINQNTQDELDRVQKEFDEVGVSSEEVAKQFKDVKKKAQDMNNEAKRIEESYRGIGGLFRSMGEDIASATKKLGKWIEKAKKAAREKSHGGGGGSWGGKAVGGSVTAGNSYLVGEHGPELFTPTNSGKISTAKETASMGSDVNINFNNVSVRNDDDLDVIVDAVKQALNKDARLAQYNVTI